MQTFVQLIVSGMAIGIIFGSVGLSFVLVFQSTRALNLAQGELAALGAFTAWTLMHVGLSYVEAFIAVVILSFGGGFLIHRFLIHPFENRERNNILLVVLALLTGINGLDLYLWGGDLKTFASPFGQKPINVGGVILNSRDIGTLVLLVVVILLMYVLFERTNLGLAMRATAQNRISAEMIGVPTDLMLACGWGLAAALGTIAAMLAAPTLFLDPNMMINVLIYALAAVTLGGLTSPLGAVVGGLFVGVFENLLGSYVGFIGDDLKLPAVLALMAVVLLVRPQGLFGRREVSRV